MTPATRTPVIQNSALGRRRGREFMRREGVLGQATSGAVLEVMRVGGAGRLPPPTGGSTGERGEAIEAARAVGRGGAR